AVAVVVQLPLWAEALRCLKCRLAASRSHVVFGSGPQHPVVLVVGESPGQEEDHSGKPFAGDAGLLLDKMLASIGLSREANTYLATIVKCRPPMNRDPAPDEQNACMHFLTRQMAALKPKAILALGRIPSQALLKTRDGIAKLRATVWNYNGIPLVATYHPNALLREETLKRPAWEDLKLLKSVLSDG
ncbi:MAG TPA: uracil-DNA glycosylase, partial [Spirochaetales bacterium]|nr:uracil-DNA glycosylase [Spirochaetales bacterium]